MVERRRGLFGYGKDMNDKLTEEQQKELGKNIAAMGRPNAATDIAKKVIELAA